jgi:hypothetical protein
MWRVGIGLQHCSEKDDAAEYGQRDLQEIDFDAAFYDPVYGAFERARNREVVAKSL